MTINASTTDPTTRHRGRSLFALLVAGLLVAAGAAAVVVQRLSAPACLGDVGFNWPNAGRVYLGGLDQLGTSVADPARPFIVAAAARVPQVRVFVGVDAAIAMWRRDRARALAGLDRMVADAETHNVQLVLSNYPDQGMISALAGHDYPSWTAAQQDLTTPGSAPYVQLGRWLADVVPRTSTQPAVAAWEVVNEPGYMLGLDRGAVPVDTGLAFVGHFADELHRLGARTVAGGGRPVFDPNRLDDRQLADYVTHIDILDDHLYPETALDRVHGVSADDARQIVAFTAKWFDRARQVAGRPDMPAMLGEVGTQSSAWFETVQSAAARHGWPVLGWGFEAYDRNAFSETTNPDVLATLHTASAAARRVNGSYPVVVGTPRCDSRVRSRHG